MCQGKNVLSLKKCIFSFKVHLHTTRISLKSFGKRLEQLLHWCLDTQLMGS